MRKKEGGMSPPSDPRDNALFAALPQEDAARLQPHLEPRTWALGDVLYDPDRAPAFLYFPTTAMVSLVHTLANGLTGEMGVVGREGVVGVALFMGGASTTSQALIQSAGGGFRLRAAVMHEEFAARRRLPHAAAALYPGLTDADCADGGVQPPAFH